MIYKEYEKTCVVCGETFIAHKITAKTCSGMCRTKLSRMNKKRNIITVTRNTNDVISATRNGNNATRNTYNVTSNGNDVIVATRNINDVTEKDVLLDPFDPFNTDDPIAADLEIREMLMNLIDINDCMDCSGYYQNKPEQSIYIKDTEYIYFGRFKHTELGYMSDISEKLYYNLSSDMIAFAKTYKYKYDIYISGDALKKIGDNYPEFFDKVKRSFS